MVALLDGAPMRPIHYRLWLQAVGMVAAATVGARRGARLRGHRGVREEVRRRCARAPSALSPRAAAALIAESPSDDQSSLGRGVRSGAS
jgi:hypothetical protein